MTDGVGKTWSWWKTPDQLGLDGEGGGGSVTNPLTLEEGAYRVNLVADGHDDNQAVVELYDYNSGGSITLKTSDDETSIQATAAPDQADPILSLKDSDGLDILTVSPQGEVVTSLDVEIVDSSKGIILTSPDNSRYRITVSDVGVLSVTEVM